MPSITSDYVIEIGIVDELVSIPENVCKTGQIKETDRKRAASLQDIRKI